LLLNSDLPGLEDFCHVLLKLSTWVASIPGTGLKRAPPGFSGSKALPGRLSSKCYHKITLIRNQGVISAGIRFLPDEPILQQHAGELAGSRFHLNIERGLLLHSVGVTCNALDVRTLLAPDIPDESIVIAALFHDLGKVGYPGKPHYLSNGIFPVPGGVNNVDYHHRECR